MLKILSYSSDLIDLGSLLPADLTCFGDPDVETCILNYQQSYVNFLKCYAKFNDIRIPEVKKRFSDFIKEYPSNPLINKNSYFIAEFSKVYSNPIEEDLKKIADDFIGETILINQSDMYLRMTKFLEEESKKLKLSQSKMVFSRSKPFKKRRKIVHQNVNNNDEIFTAEIIDYIKKYATLRRAKLKFNLTLRFPSLKNVKDLDLQITKILEQK